MKSKVLRIWMVIVLATVNASCSQTTDATVTRVYQPLAGGMVHTWIEVQLEDNTKTSVVLPDDDVVWSKARKMKGKKAKLKKSKDKWVFDGFPD